MDRSIITIYISITLYFLTLPVCRSLLHVDLNGTFDDFFPMKLVFSWLSIRSIQVPALFRFGCAALWLAFFLFGLASICTAEQPLPTSNTIEWTGTWGASPVFPIGPELNNETIRQFVRISLGGTRVRIRFTNETGTQPVLIGAAHVALGGEKGAIKPGTDHVLTFNGQRSITIPPGAPAVSDPIELNVAALQTLSISVFIPSWTGPSVIHELGVQTAYLLESGDYSGDEQLPNAKTATQRFYLSGVEVSSPGGSAGRTLVAFGDSITDGYASSVDQNKRWPDQLADRLKEQHVPGVGIVDAAISGNRILHDQPVAKFGPSALSRFDRDVLAVPGVSYIIVLEGINDIGQASSFGLPDQSVTADQIIGGLQQLIARAHARHIKIFGATLTPFEGTVFSNNFTSECETKRQAVNKWIRTGEKFDAVIDFDKAIQDPNRPTHMRPEFDSGDHLHPNDAGYKAMADAVDLELLTGSR
jgi:lysophospholipase L1-like esterase